MIGLSFSSCGPYRKAQDWWRVQKHSYVNNVDFA